MGKLVFVTGGARSGKSTFAEEYVKKIGGSIVYVATAIAFDDEMIIRIAKHQEQRPKTWNTLEAYLDIPNKLSLLKPRVKTVLLDCITVLINNVMMDEINDWENITKEEIDIIEKIVISEVQSLIDYTIKSNITMVVVTNETGSGIVPMYHSSRIFRDISGRANQLLAKASNEAYLLVASLPVTLK
ncbi:MAG: bifunctional adenosylcobinamide kinase/adenosylcobinamide-phosphate guanylyltransferase [Clostridiales bacterium]|nr:bifunctional adenosylcobinamide kinase/adenosylcobinamide-phosphate guanylyltransferase [Clostridiales bacterium]